MKQPSSCLRPLFSRAAFGFLSVHLPGAWGRLAEVKVKLKSVFSQRLHRPRRKAAGWIMEQGGPLQCFSTRDPCGELFLNSTLFLPFFLS